MDKQLFNAPIPGESLTREPGNAPWEQPPQYAKLEDAMNFYMTRFEDDEFLEELLFIVSNDMPIELVVENMLLYAEMNGKHTGDVSILLGPILHEYIKAMCDISEIEYREYQGPTKDEKKSERSKQDFQLLLSQPGERPE
jgi:hypothetical protein